MLLLQNQNIINRCKTSNIESYETGNHPVEIAKSKGLIQVSDSGEIEKNCQRGISSKHQSCRRLQKKSAASVP
jgi:Asp-tRNA(Asn)/Glu-tRNA(Gln) amidotransferase B subunit